MKTMSWTNDEEIAMMHPVDAPARWIERETEGGRRERRGRGEEKKKKEEENRRKQQERGEEAPDAGDARMCPQMIDKLTNRAADSETDD
jgi:hypothetical protein